MMTDCAPDAPEQQPVSSRRGFLTLGAAAAAAAALLPRSLGAQSRGRVKTFGIFRNKYPLILPRESVAAPTAWQSATNRLIRRVTMGITSSEVNRIRLLGYQGYLNRQLQYTKIPDVTVVNFVTTKWPLLSQTPEQIYNVNGNTVITQLQEATLYRAAFSERQIFERMVEFWSDHFNISIQKVGYLKLIDDRDVIRKHALGKFSDLLKASAHSPAMLAYLDQNLSRRGRPNENYARELMELHTMGVDGGYTQTDVAELSRVLTGWTLQGRGTFFFDPNGHDWGQKSVLGVTIPAASPSTGAAGIKEGELMLNVLAAHPNTARYIATKMLKWLLTSEPTSSQISTIAGVYRSTGGDIKLMVRAILNDGWLPAAPVKYKRPFHFLVSALRAAHPAVAAMNTMNAQINSIGQPLFVFETPDGYPDSAEFWAGNILPRWNFANVLVNSRSATTINVDVSLYLTGTPDAAIDMIQSEFFGGELALATRVALLNYLKAGTFNDARVRETIALALSSAGFQWY